MEGGTIDHRGQSKPLRRLNGKESLKEGNSELEFYSKDGYRLQKDITNWGCYKSQGEATSPSKSYLMQL